MNTERIKQAMAQLATLNAKIASNSACNALSEENHKNAIEIVLEALQSFLELGITPEQIREIDKLYAEKCKELAEEKKKNRWIPADNPPKVNEAGESDYILLSFDNFPLQCVGMYRQDEEGGAYYTDTGEEILASIGIFVNAWRHLPDRYREGNE